VLGFLVGNAFSSEFRILTKVSISMNGVDSLWSVDHLAACFSDFGGGRPIMVKYAGFCPMHRASSPEECANALGRLKVAEGVSTCLLLDVCPFRMEEALSIFRDAVDVVRIDPFSTQNHDAVSEIRGPSLLLSMAHKWMGPGRTIAKVPVDGHSVNLVLPRTLLALAHGCRAIHYMTPPAEEESKRLRIVVEDQLRAIKDTISWWGSSVPLGEIDTRIHQVGAWLVQLRPDRVALVVVRGEVADDFMGEAHFACPLPNGLRASRVIDTAGGEVARFATALAEIPVTIPDLGSGLVWYLDVLPTAPPAHAP
jgi:hypothetical protein